MEGQPSVRGVGSGVYEVWRVKALGSENVTGGAFDAKVTFMTFLDPGWGPWGLKMSPVMLF